ncbi:MAG TPA: hypothetical protein VFM46_15930, partial [Pseudomonadales bacterium]|nr:hypothetical protein [Pseudomonadales bacterium]
MNAGNGLPLITETHAVPQQEIFSEHGPLPGYNIDALIFDQDSTRIYRARRVKDGTPVMLKCLRGEKQAKEAFAC